MSDMMCYGQIASCHVALFINIILNKYKITSFYIVVCIH